MVHLGQGGLLMDYLELNLAFHVNHQLQVSSDLSSAMRGLWGRSLKKIYCYQKQLDCTQCSFENCPYYVLFEKKLSSFEQYHPYIIQSRFYPPDIVMAKFKFFGWICEHQEKLINSVLNLNHTILTRDGVETPLNLIDIRDGYNNLLWTENEVSIARPKTRILKYRPQTIDILELELKTPLRQKNQGRLMDRFSWEGFSKSIIGRIRYLDAHFNRGTLQLPTNLDLGNPRILQIDTSWSEKIRLSYRQEAKMSIGGLIGKIVLQDVTPEMVGILKLARYLHAGKQCSFGNGEIGLRNLSDSSAPKT